MYDGDILGRIHSAATHTNRHRLTGAAAGVCGFCLLGSAIASPPISQESTALSVKDLVRSMSVASRPVVRQEHMPSPNLDLRPPRVSSPTIIRGGGAAASTFTPFPSVTHPSDAGKASLATDDRRPTAVLIGELNFQVMGQAQMLARRIHQEGLPVARLVETKSALLSIGLNQRGKPGLWLTQKTH
jgi:hypothetical protein